jgi:hypothetical protein
MKSRKGEVMKCYICGIDAIKKYDWHSLCEKHYRFIQMRKTAKADKKYSPSIYELEKLVPSNMKCADCGKAMHWIDNNNRSDGAVLQHYRDGTLGIVCMACNTKHGMMPGDSYRDTPKDHKLCRTCKTIKPLSDFHTRKDGKKPYPMSKCKKCNLAVHQKWRLANPEKYRESTKRHNDMKQQNIEKYRALDRESYWRRKEQKDAP